MKFILNFNSFYILFIFHPYRMSIVLNINAMSQYLSPVIIECGVLPGLKQIPSNNTNIIIQLKMYVILSSILN